MYKEAQAEYQKALKLAKNNQEKSAAFYNLGNAHLQNNNAEKAAESYKKALSLDPGNESIVKNLQIAKKKEKEKQSTSSK